MEIELQESKKTILSDELGNGYSIELTVDHLDDDGSAFNINFGENMSWSSKDDLLKIKTMIDKAIKLYKAG